MTTVKNCRDRYHYAHSTLVDKPHNHNSRLEDIGPHGIIHVCTNRYSESRTSIMSGVSALRAGDVTSDESAKMASIQTVT